MPTKTRKPKTCRRGHALRGANVRRQKNYYTPLLPAGKTTPVRTERIAKVCVACEKERAAARRAGKSLADLRRGARE